MKRKKTGSYQFDCFRSQDKEDERLNYRSDFLVKEFEVRVKKLGIKKDAKILDVGCGTGLRAVLLSNIFSHGQVTAIDASSKLLKIANKNAKNSLSKNVQFYKQDIYSLPQKMNKFDLVYVRLLFQHLTEPEVALKNIYQALSPGGSILIEDVDRGFMGMYPSIKSWDLMFKRSQKKQIDVGGDPYVGRKLPFYLKRCGFQQIEPQIIPILGDNDFLKIWHKYFAPTYATTFNSKELAEYRKVLRELKVHFNTQSVSFYQNWFSCSGTKP